MKIIKIKSLSIDIREICRIMHAYYITLIVPYIHNGGVAGQRLPRAGLYQWVPRRARGVARRARAQLRGRQRLHGR